MTSWGAIWLKIVQYSPSLTADELPQLQTDKREYSDVGLKVASARLGNGGIVNQIQTRHTHSATGFFRCIFN